MLPPGLAGSAALRGTMSTFIRSVSMYFGGFSLTFSWLYWDFMEQPFLLEAVAGSNLRALLMFLWIKLVFVNGLSTSFWYYTKGSPLHLLLTLGYACLEMAISSICLLISVLMPAQSSCSNASAKIPWSTSYFSSSIALTVWELGAPAESTLLSSPRAAYFTSLSSSLFYRTLSIRSLIFWEGDLYLMTLLSWLWLFWHCAFITSMPFIIFSASSSLLWFSVLS